MDHSLDKSFKKMYLNIDCSDLKFVFNFRLNEKQFKLKKIKNKQIFNFVGEKYILDTKTQVSGISHF